MRKPAPDIKKVLGLLKLRYGDSPHTQLKHRNNTDLFVAVLLSPQCTDKQTNAVTERLFKKYRTCFLTSGSMCMSNGLMS